MRILWSQRALGLARAIFRRAVHRGLAAGERRKVIAFHRERNLGGGLIVKQGDPEPIEIKLAPAGRLTGRLLDENGEPITDATVDADYQKLESDDRAALWADDPNLIFNPSRIPLDKNGRFQLSGLIPGWTYNAHATAPRKLNGQMTNLVLGTVFEGVQVEPGQTKDLGDLKIKPESDEQEREEKKTEPSAKANEKAPLRQRNPIRQTLRQLPALLLKSSHSRRKRTRPLNRNP